MASRSRAYTRPGADPEGRFRPAMTPTERERAEELLKQLTFVPSAKPVVHVKLPPVFGVREAAPWLGLMGIGGSG